MKANILTDLTQLTFDRVDRVKALVAEEILKGDDRLWILGQPLNVVFTEHGLETRVTVPRGFVTDGASVPYLAQVVTGWRPWGEPHRWGAIVHDWCYGLNGSLVARGQRCGKPYADRAFRATLRAVGCSLFRAETMYRAVSLFGGHAYAIDQQTGPTVRA